MLFRAFSLSNFPQEANYVGLWGYEDYAALYGMVRMSLLICGTGGVRAADNLVAAH